MESEKNKIVNLPFQALVANDYNPNEMTEDEFAELVAEVRHLGRLPKPVIVRPNGDGYVIVDGEHGWRAAQEVKLPEIRCEVIEVDDFEAMRQTYKRNQHGTHNPVRLGKMFKIMKEERKLSNRALAKEIEVSEGTVRNSLLYAEASEVRNDYAFENLGVKQLRHANVLPETVRNWWLDSGADIPALFNAIAPAKAKPLAGKKKQEIEYWLSDIDPAENYDPGEWVDGASHEEMFLKQYHYLIDSGVLDVYFPDSSPHGADSYISLFQGAIKWNKFELEHFSPWFSENHIELKEQWRRFVLSFLKRWKKDALKHLNGILAIILDTKTRSFLITPEEFDDIIERDEYKHTGHLNDLVRIAVYEKHGEYREKESAKYNPESLQDKLQQIEIEELAPDYIKKSPLITHLKYTLWKSDGPDWAKQRLATKSYISFQPQKDIDKLVQKREYQETNEAELAKRIAKTLNKSSEKARNILAEKLILLEKIELLAICEAVEHCEQMEIFKKNIFILSEAEEK